MDSTDYIKYERWARGRHTAEDIAHKFRAYITYRIVPKEEQLGGYLNELELAFINWCATIELPLKEWRSGWEAFTDSCKID